MRESPALTFFPAPAMPIPAIRSSALAPVALLATLAGCTHGGRSGSGVAPQPSSDRTVTADDVQRNPNQPIEQILAGRVAGVDVTRTPDGGIAVHIRGATSFSSSTLPLYVLDGQPIEPGPNGSLTGINPYDIESITVLKDAASMTMYGSRGANGVIVIKTKKPPKPPKP
jgi:TonB-dependent SusC/RagA subfamily outer membrane receptor